MSGKSRIRSVANGDFAVETTLGMLVHQYKSEHFRAYLCAKNPKEILIFTTTPLLMSSEKGVPLGGWDILRLGNPFSRLW